jgi:NAD-dependent SIR2 family protein deacetylase
MEAMTTISMNAPPKGAAELRAFVAQAKVVAGFTGAGISTESGVPDFR